LGRNAAHGDRVSLSQHPELLSSVRDGSDRLWSLCRGYLASCRDIVIATRTIADAIADDIPELYILGNPPSSVVAFGSQHPNVDALEVGDAMRRRGWHLNGLSNPKSVHIACTVRFFVVLLFLFEANPFLYSSISG
jgi:hypothetical protein